MTHVFSNNFTVTSSRIVLPSRIWGRWLLPSFRQAESTDQALRRLVRMALTIIAGATRG